MFSIQCYHFAKCLESWMLFFCSSSVSTSYCDYSWYRDFYLKRMRASSSCWLLILEIRRLTSASSAWVMRVTGACLISP